MHLQDLWHVALAP